VFADAVEVSFQLCCAGCSAQPMAAAESLAKLAQPALGAEAAVVLASDRDLRGDGSAEGPLLLAAAIEGPLQCIADQVQDASTPVGSAVRRAVETAEEIICLDASGPLRFFVVLPLVSTAAKMEAGASSFAATASSCVGALVVLDSEPRTAAPSSSAITQLRLVAEAAAALSVPVKSPSAEKAAPLETVTDTPSMDMVVAAHTPEMVSVHDLSEEGRYLYASPACVQLLGWQPEELLGQPAANLFHPDDMGNMKEVRHELLGEEVEAGRKLSRNGDCVRLRRKDGSYALTAISSHRYDSFLVCVTRENTRLHELECERLENLAQYQMLAVHCTDVISLHSPTERLEFVYASPASQKMLGYDGKARGTPLVPLPRPRPRG
jgi:PAS domain S-box-containing protein